MARRRLPSARYGARLRLVAPGNLLRFAQMLSPSFLAVIVRFAFLLERIRTSAHAPRDATFFSAAFSPEVFSASAERGTDLPRDLDRPERPELRPLLELPMLTTRGAPEVEARRMRRGE